MAARPVTGTLLRDPIQVERWRIWKLKCPFKDLNGSQVLSGYVPTSDDGVVSDPIKYFNKDSMLITTTSGQRFYLIGPSGGESRDRDQLWARYYNRYRVERSDETSGRYVHKKKRALKMAG